MAYWAVISFCFQDNIDKVSHKWYKEGNVLLQFFPGNFILLHSQCSGNLWVIICHYFSVHWQFKNYSKDFLLKLYYQLNYYTTNSFKLIFLYFLITVCNIVEPSNKANHTRKSYAYSILRRLIFDNVDQRIQKALQNVFERITTV